MERPAGVEPAISAGDAASYRSTTAAHLLAPGGGFEPKPSVVPKTTVLPLDDPGTFSFCLRLDALHFSMSVTPLTLLLTGRRARLRTLTSAFRARRVPSYTTRH